MDAAQFAEQVREECLGTRVGRLHRVVTRRFDQALRPLGLSVPQVEILSALVLEDRPTRPSELAELLLTERSTISRTLAALQERGRVRVVGTSATGRAMTVEATQAGADALADARAAWAAAQQDVRAALGDRAAGTVDGWLAALVAP